MIHKPQLWEWAIREQHAAALSAAASLYASVIAGGKPAIPEINFRLAMKTQIPMVVQYRETVEREASLGTQVHRAIEWYLKRRMKLPTDTDHVPYLNDRAKPIYEMFKVWACSIKLNPIAVELPLAHASLPYGCTIDLVAEIDGVLTMIDVKTSRSLWKEYWLQLHACVDCWHSLGYPEISHMGILKLPKDRYADPATLVPVDYKQSTLDAFQGLLQAYEFMEHEQVAVEGKRLESPAY
jgi:hypothetical protein